MSVIDRWHDARREEERAAAQALDLLQLAVTVLVEVPRYVEVGARPSDLSDEEFRQLQSDRVEMLRIARLYADSRLVDHVSTSQIIDRLSEGLA